MNTRNSVALLSLLLVLLFWSPDGLGLPAEDVQPVTNEHYFTTARKLIREAKKSVLIMMFEMGYYTDRPTTPSNLLVKELIEARKREVRVEVILDVRKDEDRTTKRNRHTGSILSEGGVKVIYDSLGQTTHAKLMVIDGLLTLLGSTNWTYYALSNNNEVAVLIRSKEVAQEMTDYFEKVKSAGSKK